MSDCDLHARHMHAEICVACPALLSQDPLTGLADRRHLISALASICEQRAPASLLLLDLDGFKGINDSLGHPAGDELLRSVAGRLRQGVRITDLQARLGGDEFAIVLMGAGGKTAKIVAERIVSMLARPFFLGGQVATIGASLGFVRLPLQAATPEQALRHADLALYRAKAEGRGRALPFHPGLLADAEARRHLELELRAALPLRQVVLAYQPHIELRGLTATGFEALARWRHPTRGLVLPEEFIPLAERGGLMRDFGRWVLYTACAEAARWPRGARVYVNLSSCQFDGDGLPPLIAEALRRSGLAPHRLGLEVNEAALLPRGAAALEQLEQLRAMGVAIILDDFGTGHSSLALLERFRFDRLKVDRRFIASAGAEPRATAIMRSVVGLAAALSLRCTAEGVETEAQLRFAREAGCDEAQGFFLGMPLPADAVPAFLATSAAAAGLAA